MVVVGVVAVVIAVVVVVVVVGERRPDNDAQFFDADVLIARDDDVLVLADGGEKFGMKVRTLLMISSTLSWQVRVRGLVCGCAQVCVCVCERESE